MTFSRDGKTLATSAAGGVTKIWDVPKGKAVATLTSVWFPVWISADVSTLAAQHDKGFELRRLPSGKVLAKVSDGGSRHGLHRRWPHPRHHRQGQDSPPLERTPFLVASAAVADDLPAKPVPRRGLAD
jgi:WD40 repeat protein